MGLGMGAIDYITKPFSLPIVEARVRNHMELKRNRDLAESAVRTKAHFLASMSHEIRTPLNAILGTTKLLLDTEVTPSQRERIQVLEFAGESLMALLNDILDLSRIEAGMFHLEESDFHVRDLLSKALFLLRLQAQDKNLALKSLVSKDVPEKLKGDHNRLRQILINLVDNAIKFTEEGEVTVRMAVEKRLGEELDLHFTVSDSGMGIAPEHRESIFKRFIRANGSKTLRNEGSGLGLAISRQLAEAMGGRLWVESELGKGSDFHFTVRLRASCKESLTQKQNPGRSQQGSDLAGSSILLVDDNILNQGIATVMLRSLGCSVKVASTGLEAVAACEIQDFDIILMDIQLPDIDGLEAAGIIREKERSGSADSLVIIGQSAYSSGDYRERCLAAGMDEYIAKPFRKQDLLTKLRDCLAARGHR